MFRPATCHRRASAEFGFRTDLQVNNLLLARAPNLDTAFLPVRSWSGDSRVTRLLIIQDSGSTEREIKLAVTTA